MMLTAQAGLVTVEPAIGEIAVELEANRGIGDSTMLVFLKRDMMVMIHTAQPDGMEPLVSTEGLRQLAKTVAGRI